MAQKMLEAQAMPELKLRQELRNRFPEITGTTLMKVMKQYNNDTEKCIQALEQESQKSLFGGPPDTNNHPSPTNHSNHSPGNNINRNNNHHQPGALGKFGSPSQPGGGMSRYQELPVQHETTHISTVQHMVGPPSIPPKPLPPKPDKNPFAHPTMPPVHTRPLLVIDPANKGDAYPHTAPAKPHDFAPFMDNAPRKQTDIPNIRCGPTSLGAGGASGGSPESRRPVRVINVQGYPSGGTVTSGVVVSPTSVSSNPRFKVVRGDGGGVCSTSGSSAPVTSPNVNPYRFAQSAYVQPQTWAQETERPALHSSSIYIDSAMNPRRTNIQESGNDSSSSAQPHHYVPSNQYIDSQGPSSVPVPRTTQPLTVSISSHAISQGLPERGQNVAPVTGFPFHSGFNTGFANPAPVFNTSGGYMMNIGGGQGGRFTQEGVSHSPPRPTYPVPIATGLSQLSISPGVGAVGPPPVLSTPSPNMMGMAPPFGAMSPVMLPKAQSLQHQRSIGSSTSRSNSMDSEHGSTHYLSDPASDPNHPPHPVHPQPHHRLVGIGVPSPASSQSSLSSESSARDRDPNSVPRQRSGSVQEEAAYSQALLHHQRQRMDKLTEDIESKRQLLSRLRQEVSDYEKSKIVKHSLRKHFPTADDIARLCESNRRLQTDIQMYLNEIDMYRNGQTPFSVIDPMGQQNFFNNMPTGPNDLFSRPQIQRQRTPPPPPPPRPPPPRPLPRVNSNDLDTRVPPPAPGHTQGGGSADSEEGEKWACTACTFENHPALKKCEICEMPRMMSGS